MCIKKRKDFYVFFVSFMIVRGLIIGGTMTSLNEFVLEKKENKLNASVVMLFLYSMVVSFALVLVITKNFETDAEIEVQEEKVVCA